MGSMGPMSPVGSVETGSWIPLNKKLKSYFQDLGGHMNNLKKLEDITQQMEVRISEWNEDNPWPFS